MRVVIQRVREASVAVADEIIGRIGAGMLVLVGIEATDGDGEIEHLAGKILNLRIFEDGGRKMNRSLLDVRGELLVVSQFTLYGDCRKGRRPSFLGAAGPEIAAPIHQRFLARLAESGLRVQCGRFGADMAVSLVNDGPVTLILDAPEKG